MSDSNEIRGRAEDSGANLYGALLEGLTTLSGAQRVRFNSYTRMVLPADGYVFWFRAGEFYVNGSLHIDATRQQLEDETITINRIAFTTNREIAELNAVAPGNLVVGTYQNMRFALDRRGFFYQEAKIWHYEGQVVYPAMASQLIDDPEQLDTANVIVSNSLPAWLSLATYNPIWLTTGNPGLTLYPSFLVPDNITPAYGAVHIPPDATRSLQLLPWLSNTSSHYQLSQDRVKITLYGCDNATAQSFVDLVIQYCTDSRVIGLVAPPTPVLDEKRTQPSLTVLAQKKTIQFEVSYNQEAMRNVARQLIESASTTWIPTRPFTGIPTTPQPYYSPMTSPGFPSGAIVLPGPGIVVNDNLVVSEALPITATGANISVANGIISVVGGIWNPTVSLTSRMPLSGEELFKLILSYPAQLPAMLPVSNGGCEVAPTADAVFTLSKNGASIGSATIPARMTTAFFTLPINVDFSVGDTFSFTAPTPQDATMSGIYFSFLGARSAS
jgi:hypothetical protein